MKLPIKKTLLSLFAVLILPFISTTIHAQSTENDFGVAYPVSVELSEGQTVENGMLVSHIGGKYILSSEAYDRNIIGAINIFPKIEFTETVASNKTPVVSSGVSEVLVSGENGSIVPGDYIAASGKPGVGMKAVKSGFTLGIATESYDGATIDDQGLVKVRISKDFTFAQDSPDSETIGNRLRDIVSISAIAAIDDPQVVFKYVVAALILLISIIIAFVSFSRTSQKGIEALGRNPLARSSITTGIFVNILVSIIILSAGLAGAYVIVTL
jgi:hypothetical protein